MSLVEEILGDKGKRRGFEYLNEKNKNFDYVTKGDGVAHLIYGDFKKKPLF